MSDVLKLTNPEIEIETIVSFIRETFSASKKTAALIGVSGGIDSALSLTLAVKALSPEKVFPVLLPYKDQDTLDSQTICEWNKIPKENITTIQIEPLVTAAAQLTHADSDTVRLGNIMARVRMIVLYDLAKQRDALVCGTENKSEKYLGYFTRFGDGASDLEPIQHLYKTQVRQLAQHLAIPEQIIQKHPSAGLWENQTDEQELGFSYADADLVLNSLVDEKTPPSQISIPGIDPATIQKVVARVVSQLFKHETPYTL